jgi:hypothetical protein
VGVFLATVTPRGRNAVLVTECRKEFLETTSLNEETSLQTVRRTIQRTRLPLRASAKVGTVPQKKMGQTCTKIYNDAISTFFSPVEKKQSEI